MKIINSNFFKRKMLRCSVVIMMCLVVFSCANKQGSDSANGSGTPKTPTYPVFKVASQTATLKTNYPATIQGEQNIEIRPKIDGYIEKMYVDEGAVVKKGQLLFRISAPQYQQ